MSDRPKWVYDAERRYYDPRGNLSLETNIQRTSRTINILREKILPSIHSNSPLSLLEIGVGLDAHLIQCPYEPYRIAGLLEHEGSNYRMAIVDKNPEVITDVARRSRIFILQTDTDSIFSVNDQQSEREAWSEYLFHTRQPEKVTHELDDQLIFGNWLKDHEKADFLMRGVRVANIPESFQRKSMNGQIQLINGDIAKTYINLEGFFPYQVVVAQFVFPYLKEEGQKLALYNLAQAVEKGGYIVVDNLKTIMAWMDFFFKQEFGGWLTESELNDLDLRIAYHESISDNYEIYVFEKVE